MSQIIETPLGRVVLTATTDYAGRETVTVDLKPAEGCDRDGCSLKREHPMPAANFPTKKALTAALKNVREWIEKQPQPTGAAYSTHFGCGPREPIDCLRIKVAPGFVWVNLTGDRTLHSIRGRMLRPLTDDEKNQIRKCVHAAGFRIEDDWHGHDFHSFRVVNHARSSNIVAYGNYQAFSGRPEIPLVVPDGWSD